MSLRRRPSKISRLPSALKQEVNRRLDSGESYDAIVGWLETEGVSIGKSSICRYAQDLSERLSQVELAAAPVKAMVEQIKINGLDLTEAEEQLSQQLIVELLMQPADTEAGNLPKLLSAVAKIQSNSLRRRELDLKAQSLEMAKRKMAAILDSAEREAKSQGERMSKEEMLDYIKREVYGL